jgi:hypothetical protein
MARAWKPGKRGAGMKNKATYALHYYTTGELLDTGAFSYDDYFFHLMDQHDGVGMICDILANSYLDEYLSCMLVEHINHITDWDQRIIYIHDYPSPSAGDMAYDCTPWFCIADDDIVADDDSGSYSLARLKPYMVLILTDIVEFRGADE